MVADDPLGRDGPMLDEFLTKPKKTTPRSSPATNPQALTWNRNTQNKQRHRGSRMRDNQTTKEYCKRLLAIFPDDQELILRILEQNNAEFDISVLTDKVLRAQSSN